MSRVAEALIQLAADKIDELRSEKESIRANAISILEAIADGQTLTFDEEEGEDVWTWMDEEELQTIAREGVKVLKGLP